MRQSAARRDPSPRAVPGSAAVFLLSLVLLNGLIASRILVECFPSDGSSLVELIGQDPCHHPFGVHEHKSCRTSLGESDASDPCLDLVLDNFGVTQSGAILPSPATLVTDLAALSAQAVADLFQAPNAVAPFKLAREPVLVPGCGPYSNPCIRI